MRNSATLAELYERLGSLKQPSQDDPSEVWVRRSTQQQREWSRYCAVPEGTVYARTGLPLPDELQRWRLPAKGETT